MEIDLTDNSLSFGGVGELTSSEACGCAWRGRDVRCLNQHDPLDRTSFDLESPVFAEPSFLRGNNTSAPSSMRYTPPPMPSSFNPYPMHSIAPPPVTSVRMPPPPPNLQHPSIPPALRVTPPPIVTTPVPRIAPLTFPTTRFPSSVRSVPNPLPIIPRPAAINAQGSGMESVGHMPSRDTQTMSSVPSNFNVIPEIDTQLRVNSLPLGTGQNSPIQTKSIRIEGLFSSTKSNIFQNPPTFLPINTTKSEIPDFLRYSPLSPDWKVKQPPIGDLKQPFDTTPRDIISPSPRPMTQTLPARPSFIIDPDGPPRVYSDRPSDPKTFEIPGKKLARGAIGGINGIGNNLSDASANASYLAQISGGYQVDWVYNKTHSAPIDVLEVALLNSKGYSAPAGELKAAWLKFHQDHINDPDAKFLQFSHSQGAMHVKNALESAPQEIRDRVISLAIAPAVVIPKNLCFNSFNYASKKDIIPYAQAALNYDADASYEDRISEPNFVALKELILLDPHPDHTDFLDHGLNSLTVQEVIKLHLQEYIEKYGESK